MRQEKITAISGDTIYTASGAKTAIGNARHKVGDYVWTDGRCVFGHQPVRNQPAPYVPRPAMNILIAGTDGQYALVDRNTLSVVSSGVFKNWPSDFIANASGWAVTSRVAYNGNYAVVLVSVNDYDTEGNQVTTFTCFDLTTGLELFNVTGYDIINSSGFYLEVSNTGDVSFGGISMVYGSENKFVSQKYTDGIMTTTIIVESDLRIDTSVVGEALQYLESIRNVNMSRRTAYVRNYYGGVCATSLYREDIGINSFNFDESASLSVSVLVPTEPHYTSSYLSKIIAGNAKTGNYIGTIGYSVGQQITVSGHVTANALSHAGVNPYTGSFSGTSYRMPFILANTYTDGSGNPSKYPIWPENYLPNGIFSDGLWDFPQTINSPDFGKWDPETYDSIAAQEIADQNKLPLLVDFPESGYAGQVILHLDYNGQHGAGANWYMWKNDQWMPNGTGPRWSGSITPGPAYRYTPMTNNGYCVEPSMKRPYVTNMIGSADKRYCQSMDVSFATSESVNIQVNHVGNMLDIVSLETINQKISISGTETYFPTAIACTGESQASGGGRMYMHISEMVTWGQITYGEELGYGSGYTTVEQTVEIERRSIVTAYSTPNHEVAAVMNADGTEAVSINGVDVPNTQLYGYVAYAATEYKDKFNKPVFLMICGNNNIIKKTESGIETISSMFNFEVGSTQIGQVSNSLLGKL